MVSRRPEEVPAAVAALAPVVAGAFVVAAAVASIASFDSVASVASATAVIPAAVSVRVLYLYTQTKVTAIQRRQLIPEKDKHEFRAKAKTT